jgi:hypothetical protein
MDNILDVPNNSSNSEMLDNYVSQKRKLHKCEDLIREFMDEVFTQDCNADAEMLTDFQIRWYNKFDGLSDLPL